MHLKVQSDISSVSVYVHMYLNVGLCMYPTEKNLCALGFLSLDFPLWISLSGFLSLDFLLCLYTLLLLELCCAGGLAGSRGLLARRLSFLLANLTVQKNPVCIVQEHYVNPNYNKKVLQELFNTTDPPE